ncbi:MAG: TonB-dependent receptor plug domain-containing protein, partial [Segetibacter sp.]
MSYKFTFKLLFLINFIFLALNHAIAQVKEITGVVSNKVDATPLEGVTVTIKGGSAATQTNANGKFSIKAAPGSVLVFSYTGFAQKEVNVTASSFINLSMEASTARMDEVVVVGYGTQSRRTLTGSVATVNSAAFQHSPSTNVATVLQGTLPGLVVRQSTGQPGTSPSITFRGGSDFNGNGTPLFVVDGVIVPSLYGLDMNDIASIDLLKDAASTAIYGARAANGVVLVTTKKGKKGSAQVSYSVGHTTNYIRRNSSEYLNGAQYISMNRMGIRSRFLGDSLDNNINAMNSDRGQLSGSWGWALSSGWTSPIGLYTTQLVSNANRKYLNDPAWKLLIDANPFISGQMDSILYKDLP